MQAVPHPRRRGPRRVAIGPGTGLSASLLVLAALLLLLAPRVVHAQGATTAAVGGRVVDAAGEPVPEARVTVRHAETGVSSAALTGPTGRYHIGNLRPGGPWVLTASRPGFRSARRDEMDLPLGETLRADLVLVRETISLPDLEVTVEADPAFTPSRMGTGTRIGEERIERQPTIGRDFTELAAVSPLVTLDDEGISVAGQNALSNNVQIDGALSQDVFGLSPTGAAGGQAGARAIPLEAIDRYQVLVAPYDVRQSGFTGGVLNAVTRSGTNTWESSAFGFYRDERLLGTLTVDGVPSKPDELTQLSAGFTAGGPIVRDRLHLFTAAQLERRRLPPPGFHAGRDRPLRTGLAADSVRRMANLLRDYGAEPGSWGPVTLENDLANVFLRLDAEIDEGHRLMARHNYSSAEDGTNLNRLPGEPYELSSHALRQRSSSHSTVLQLLSELGDGLSNDLLVNLQWNRDVTRPAVRDPRVQVTIRSAVDGRLHTRRTRAGANLFAHGSELDQNILEIDESLTWRRGDHRLTAGVSAQRFGLRRLFAPGALGSWEFGSLADLEADRADRYDVRLSSPGSGDAAVEFSVLQWAGYLQDEWTLSDRLSLRAGARVDVPVIPGTPPANPELAAEFAEFGVRTDRMPPARPLFSPRAAFNLRLPGEHRTQIRGGAGLFTGRPPFAWLANAYANTGLRADILSCENEAAPAYDPTAPPPRDCREGAEDGGVQPPDVNVVDPGFRFPQHLKISLGIDRELPLGLVGSLDALYSRAVRQILLQDLNIADAVDDPRHEDGYSSGLGPRDHFGTPTLEGFAPRRRSDAFGRVIRLGNTDGDYAYAVSLELRRTFDDSFSLEAAYAYNRSGDVQSLTSTDATTAFGLNPIEGDPNDPKLQPSRFDRPHRIVLSGWGRLPESWGGTEVSLFYVGRSGPPYSYVYADDANGDGYPGGGRTLELTNDLVYVPLGLGDVEGSPASLLLAESLIREDPCLEENRGRILSRNACRAPWSNRLDLRITQRLSLGGGDLRVTLDLLNALNLVNGAWGHRQTVNRAVQVFRFDGRADQDALFGPAPTPEDPVRLRYVGPVAHDPDSGSVGAELPYGFAVPDSQWQAQLGLRVSF